MKYSYFNKCLKISDLEDANEKSAFRVASNLANAALLLMVLLLLGVVGSVIFSFKKEKELFKHLDFKPSSKTNAYNRK